MLDPTLKFKFWSLLYWEELILSRPTLLSMVAPVADLYLLKAAVKTSSDTSLLRSPTKRRNQADSWSVKHQEREEEATHRLKLATPYTVL